MCKDACVGFRLHLSCKIRIGFDKMSIWIILINNPFTVTHLRQLRIYITRRKFQLVCYFNGLVQDCNTSIVNQLQIYRIMHELPWITISGSRVRRFSNSSHSWQLMANRPTLNPKIVIHGNEWIFYFLHAISCPEHTKPLETIIDRWFRHCRCGRSFLT